ncbi:MAG: hypothetical protein R3F13_02610 [Prosthecobacter sp.]
MHQSTTCLPSKYARFIRWRWPAALVLFWAVGVIFLNWSGMSSDLGGDPDEAAHAVTSLMVRDYLAAGFGRNPLAFAKTYYEDFPRIALGHYPPLYYMVAGSVLLPRVSIQTLFILQALTHAALATLTISFVRRQMSPWLTAATGIGTFVLPVGLKLAQHVMSDTLLAFFCLWSAVAWANYLRTPTRHMALLWGCIAAAAILTKGSGMGLCLLPPTATLLSGKWRLIFTGSWWCAALPVAMLAGPWMLYSTSISREGMTMLTPSQYFIEAVPFYVGAMPHVFGWAMTILSLLGIWAGLTSHLRCKSLSNEAASLAGMALGMSAVLLLVPVGLISRYMLTLAPVVMITAAYGLEAVPWRTSAPVSKAILLLVLIGVFIFNSGLPVKEVHGFTQAVTNSGLPVAGSTKQNWLIASDPRGEGAIIAAAAFNCPQRSPSPLRVYRGSKELASSDWMGRDYRSPFADASAMLQHLDKLKVSRVFVDMSVPAAKRLPHEQLLYAAMQSADDRWALDFEQPITRRPSEAGVLRVYQRIPPASFAPPN